jgi:hypothetical protein
MKASDEGASRLKSVSFVINVIPCSRHETAINASLRSDGLSAAVCQPSAAARPASARPLSTNATADGGKHATAPLELGQTPSAAARALPQRSSHAANSCVTTALRQVNGSALFRNAKTSACASSFRNPSMKRSCRARQSPRLHKRGIVHAAEHVLCLGDAPIERRNQLRSALRTRVGRLGA